MKIKNNIIDRLEKDADNFLYTLNIGLKSGEVVYIDGISKGEKNGYLNFAKHSQETMILQIDEALWRISAEDIESINVKKYKKSTNKTISFLNSIFLSESKFESQTYFMWIKWFVFGAIVSILIAAAKTILQGDMMNMLTDPDLPKMIITNSLLYMDKVFFAIILILIITFVIDCILPSNEPYKRLKPFPDYAQNPRIRNLATIIIFLLVYKIVAAFLSSVI